MARVRRRTRTRVARSRGGIRRMSRLINRGSRYFGPVGRAVRYMNRPRNRIRQYRARRNLIRMRTGW